MHHNKMACFIVLLLGAFGIDLLEIDALLIDGTAPVTNGELLNIMTRLQIMVYSHDEQISKLNASCTKCTGTNQGVNAAFMVTMTKDVSNCNSNAGLIFERVLVNHGSVYDVRHGVFTAPVNGTYHFAITVTTPTGNAFHIAIVRNFANNMIGYLYSDTQHGMWELRTTSIVVDLTAGDDVWVVCLGGSNYITGGGTYHSHWSGFLVNR